MQKLVKLKSKKSKRDIVTNTNNEIISTAFVRNNISQKNTKQSELKPRISIVNLRNVII